MKHKLEKIVEILESEKKKRLEKAAQKKRKVLQKEEKKRLAIEKAEKWAMLRWINKYIEENKENWEDLELVKIQENLPWITISIFGRWMTNLYYVAVSN